MNDCRVSALTEVVHNAETCLINMADQALKQVLNLLSDCNFSVFDTKVGPDHPEQTAEGLEHALGH